jgi:hypothetical protein
MKTIIVTDALAADLVAKNEAEYASGDVHLAPAMPAHVQAALAPVQVMAVNGRRVDQPCPQGTPGTVTLAATGHTLSLPEVAKGEMFAGYCGRVYLQCGAQSADAVGSLFLGTGVYFERFGGFKPDGSNWPQAADFFFDAISGGTAAYATEAERNAPKGTQTFEDVGKKISEQQVITPADVGSVASVVGEVPIEASQQ